MGPRRFVSGTEFPEPLVLTNVKEFRTSGLGNLLAQPINHPKDNLNCGKHTNKP